MTMKPLYDRVLVKIEKAEKEEKTVGGIVLAAKTAAGPAKGEVVAVGDGKFSSSGERLPMQVKVGDKVYLPQGAGQTVKADDEEYSLVYESEILGLIEE